MQPRKAAKLKTVSVPAHQICQTLLPDLAQETLDIRIVGLQLCEAGRVGQRLLLMPQIALKTGGGVKALSIIGMATEQFAQNLGRLCPVAGAGDAHGVDIAK